MESPTVALLGAGGMGSKMALRMTTSGCTRILTPLDGRSEATRLRASESGMIHASYTSIVSEASYIISVVPPQDAYAVAEKVAQAWRSLADSSQIERDRKLVFADCNAVNVDTVKRMAALFTGTDIIFIDGAIIGGPPSDSFNPGIYLSSNKDEEQALDDLVKMLSEYGLRPFPLKREGAALGDASALKMANTGIVKGAIGLFSSMILAAHACSPSTAQGLLHSLHISQSDFIHQMIRLVPQMFPKAYRFVGEFKELETFTASALGAEESRTYQGIGRVFERIAKSHAEGTRGDGGEVDVISAFMEEAKNLWVSDPGVIWTPPSIEKELADRRHGIKNPIDES